MADRDARGSTLSLEQLISVLAVGVVAGVAAHLFFRFRGFGLVGDIIVSLIGAFVGSWVLPAFGLSLGGGVIGALLTAAVGAVAVLTVLRILKRA
jgi:uncharacterized membrane protein YeaQ/YmgE (transglycosylase-associated protein family)